MSVRSWLVGRATERPRSSGDTSLRLPMETVARGLRTSAAARVGEGWVWPHWLERQLDPTSPAFVPRGDLPFLTNVTARGWTTVGNVASPWEGVVDPRGLVTPLDDGWSLDWWIGADDRWHLPSREVAVRQRLVDDAPVVETAMRVPGGDAVQRVFAMQASSREGGAELVVVEIENQSRVPFAVALVVRPFNPLGVAVVERIGLHEGTSVSIDGRLAMVLPRVPNRMAGSTLAEGDVAGTVLSGAAGTSFPPDLRCESAMASAAFVYPLAHTATLRVVLPLAPVDRTRRRGLGRRRVPDARRLPARIPSATDVAAGWRAQSGRGMRLEVPDERLMSCVEANRRFLLLFHDGDEAATGPALSRRSAFRGDAHLLGALDRYGYREEAAEVLAAYPDRQHGDGHFGAGTTGWDATGAAIHALAEHWRLHRQDPALQGIAPGVARGAEWIERARRPRRGSDPALRGLLPAGSSADRLGPPEVSYRDDLWSLRGLLDAAELLAAAGEVGAAEDAMAAAGGLRADLDASLALVAERLGTQAVPAGPTRRIDAGAVASLAAVWPLRLMAADDPRMHATADVVRDRFLQGPACTRDAGDGGLSPQLTLQLAFAELEAGDRRALDRLAWVLDAATPTWTWPEVVHPRMPGGCAGDGHHRGSAADLLTFVRNLLVRETFDGGLALCSMVPDTWLGGGIEVHDAPTHHGLVSFAVRWHGERPALLWELVPQPGVGEVRITVPGLDPTWSTTERAGDALLAPVHPSDPVVVEETPAAHPRTDVAATPVNLSKRTRD
ncbi:MAG TPA: hypothetical protein VMN58_07720 [Acidimicrobiales bacterium]|nr:hypothetical protein [Acidimicrobiales bacterium]